MNGTERSVVETIIRLIEKHTYLTYDKKQDLLKGEIYADYRDEASDKSITAWCQSQNPIRVSISSSVFYTRSFFSSYFILPTTNTAALCPSLFTF